MPRLRPTHMSSQPLTPRLHTTYHNGIGVLATLERKGVEVHEPFAREVEYGVVERRFEWTGRYRS